MKNILILIIFIAFLAGCEKSAITPDDNPLTRQSDEMPKDTVNIKPTVKDWPEAKEKKGEARPK